MKKLTRTIENIVIVALILGVLFINWMIYNLVIIPSTTEEDPVCTLPAKELKEHRRLLRKHGLLWDVSIIYRDDNGQQYFIRDGKRCRFE